MNRARAETCSVEEKYMTEKLLRSLLKRSENIKTSSPIELFWTAKKLAKKQLFGRTQILIR